MPRKRTYRRISRRRPAVGRKRRFSRKKRRNAPIVRVNRGVSVTPDAILVKMRYPQGILLSGGAGFAGNVFRGNSLFDPDLTGVGNQPFGFDEWKNLYNRYQVYASSCKVVARSNQSTASGLAMLAIVPQLESVLPLDGYDELGEARARKRMLAPLEAGNATYLKNYISVRKIFGNSPAQANDLTYSATPSLNPVSQFFWHIFVQQVTNVLATVDTQIYVEMTYYVKWYERVPLSRS